MLIWWSINMLQRQGQGEQFLYTCSVLCFPERYGVCLLNKSGLC